MLLPIAQHLTRLLHRFYGPLCTELPRLLLDALDQWQPQPGSSNRRKERLLYVWAALAALHGYQPLPLGWRRGTDTDWLGWASDAMVVAAAAYLQRGTEGKCATVTARLGEYLIGCLCEVVAEADGHLMGAMQGLGPAAGAQQLLDAMSPGVNQALEKQVRPVRGGWGGCG
jgi:hypothetical protein